MYGSQLGEASNFFPVIIATYTYREAHTVSVASHPCREYKLNCHVLKTAVHYYYRSTTTTTTTTTSLLSFLFNRTIYYSI